MLIYDRAFMTSRERTPEGYLKVRARLARTGIQDYLRGEIGLDGDPYGRVRVYRPPEEVFDDIALQSFAMKPVTDDHPSVDVDASNIRTLSVGWSGETIARDGEFAAATLLITDQDAIAKIEGGKSELSPGYRVELHMTPGKTPKGEAYDAVQRKIRGNHIAIVDAGRCGGDCRILDRSLKDCGGACGCASCLQKKEPTMSDKPNAEFVVDGLPVETIEEHRQVIQRLQDQRAKDKERMREIHNEVLQAQDRYRARERELEDVIADLKAKVSDAEVEKKAEARVELIMKAADYLPDDYETGGKTTVQIAKDAIVAAYGASDIVSKKTDEQILGMFDMLNTDAANGAQPLGKVVTPKNRQTNDTGYGEYKQRLNDGWKGQPVDAGRAA